MIWVWEITVSSPITVPLKPSWLYITEIVLPFQYLVHTYMKDWYVSS